MVSVISMSFVAVSIVGMVISTMPQLKSIDGQGNLVENPRLAMIETVCIAWFTLEYFLRFAKERISSFKFSCTLGWRVLQTSGLL